MPSYLDKLRPTFPNKSDVEIELLCAQIPNIDKRTGLTNHQHRMNAMALIWPDRVNHEWRERIVKGYELCRKERRKELMLSGSSNSNKTGTMADLGLQLWWEHPEQTTVYIASPYKEATQAGLWARIVEQFEDATRRHPCLPGRFKLSENKILLHERNPLSFIQVVTVDEIGKLVGKKSKSFASGLMLIMIDELPELPNNGQAMVSVMNNLISVPNLLLIGAGNFADTDDAMGVFSEPRGSYDRLRGREDDLHEWETSRGGLCYRFDGEQSPNVKAGKDIYPNLTTIEYLKNLEALNGGRNTPGYFRYGRSFPQLDTQENTVTNALKIEAGGAEADFEWGSGALTYCAFLDAGFGGDPGVLQALRFGTAIIEGEEVQALELWGQPSIVPLQLGLKDDSGIGVTIEAQIVAYTKDWLAEREIPIRNFGFDGSMRSGIVQEFDRGLGTDVIALDFGGPATDRPMSAKSEKLWNEEAFNFVSELWLRTALVIQFGQMKGLQNSSKAKQQLCRRKVKWTGKKRQIETKADFKKTNKGQSPNEADALVGGVEIAVRRGFRLAGVTAGKANSKSLLQVIEEMETKARVKQFMQNTLPQGRLHSNQYRETPSNGRLRSQIS